MSFAETKQTEWLEIPNLLGLWNPITSRPQRIRDGAYEPQWPRKISQFHKWLRVVNGRDHHLLSETNKQTKIWIYYLLRKWELCLWDTVYEQRRDLTLYIHIRFGEASSLGIGRFSETEVGCWSFPVKWIRLLLTGCLSEGCSLKWGCC